VCIVAEKKDDGAGFNLEGMEAFMESRSQDFIHVPGILSEEPGETGERSGKERGAWTKSKFKKVGQASLKGVDSKK
jgi:hypothetical protein